MGIFGFAGEFGFGHGRHADQIAAPQAMHEAFRRGWRRGASSQCTLDRPPS